MIEELLEERILIIDGAMGTMVQTFDLGEDDFRGEEFSRSEIDLIGNNEALNITREDIVLDIHRQYLDAGCDIIETNTFSANSISQKDYGLEGFAKQMNIRAAKIARKAVEEAFENDGRKKKKWWEYLFSSYLKEWSKKTLNNEIAKKRFKLEISYKSRFKFSRSIYAR